MISSNFIIFSEIYLNTIILKLHELRIKFHSLFEIFWYDILYIQDKIKQYFLTIIQNDTCRIFSFEKKDEM